MDISSIDTLFTSYNLYWSIGVTTISGTMFELRVWSKDKGINKEKDFCIIEIGYSVDELVQKVVERIENGKYHTKLGYGPKLVSKKPV